MNVQSPREIKVLIVDDQLSMRMLIREILHQTPDLKVVGTAGNGIEARDKIRDLQPDVLTLDVEMPEMDGLTFLEKLMKLSPMPVVMISTLTQKGSSTAIKALELGAVDVIGKPEKSGRRLLEEQAEEVCNKIRAAAYARVHGQSKLAPALPSAAALNALNTTKVFETDAVLPRQKLAVQGGPLICIGSSTGGTEAVRTILQNLPNTLPPIAVVQHISAGFTKTFAQRLSELSSLDVTEARDGMPMEHGCAYIAPGDKHLAVRFSAGKYYCRLLDGERVSRHKPSVDVLFRSAADMAGSNAVGIILTGMGDDGAKGLKEMKDAGAYTIGQDEASCVVYGMPKAALGLGALSEQLSLGLIATKIERYLSKG